MVAVSDRFEVMLMETMKFEGWLCKHRDTSRVAVEMDV